MPFLAVLTALYVSSESSAQGCINGLRGGLPPLTEYVRVRPTPFVQQCSGNCRAEAALSHIGNLLGKDLNSDYMTLKRIEDNVEKNLAVAKAGRLDEIIVSQFGYVDLALPPQSEAGSFDGTLKKLHEMNALVKASQFTLTSEFTEVMNGHAKRFGFGATSPIRMLNVVLGIVFRQMKDAIEAGVPNALSDNAAIAKHYLELAQAGLSRENDAAENSRWLSARIHGRTELFPSDAPYNFKGNTTIRETEGFIKKEIDAGRNVMLFYIDAELTELPSGRTSLKRSLKEELQYIRTNRDLVFGGKSGHVVTIDGYHLDKERSMDWLLIKNSDGSEIFSDRYMPMHIDYFRAYTVFVQSLQQRFQHP